MSDTINSDDIATHELRVRYAETDRMGVAHHTYYLVWFEAGRTDYMRERDVRYRDLEEKGIFLPVSEYSCRMMRSAKYDDLITVRTSVESLKSRQVTFNYRVMHGKKLLATGKTVHICTDKNARPILIPDWIKEGLLRKA